jgi:predicted nucleic acid-binding Zn ribbon protein
MDQRQCMLCQEPITGRSDKRFCGDQCRNIYNNRERRQHKKIIYKINRRLLQNYSILKKLNPRGKTKVSRKKLEDASFSFTNITSIYRTRAGKIYYFIYDQGYMPLGDGWYILVQREE